jgi:hypothetical protein
LLRGQHDSFLAGMFGIFQIFRPRKQSSILAVNSMNKKNLCFYFQNFAVATLTVTCFGSAANKMD